MDQKIIECVPNFSEGKDLNIIRQITHQIEITDGVKLLDTDPGKATNRTVVTFAGDPDAVIEAAFLAIKKAKELIDMSKHRGEHPRFGGTDVCPLVPVANITMDETVEYAKKLAERVGKELNIGVYLYEYAASREERRNLSTVRAGEYEGLPQKLKDPDWKPDYGPAIFNPRTGVTAIGARDFLIAYNVNLNTTSTRRANAVAFDVREQGRVKRIGDTVTGKIVNDSKGDPVRIPGKLKSVKAIGWYIKEYGIAQISINLTNVNITPVHIAFDEVCKSAGERGLRVTGSELVGLIPLKCMMDAGKYFLKKQQRSSGVSEDELIHIAIKSLGLNDLYPFDPKKKIIEYMLHEKRSDQLVFMSLKKFSDETASESPAPGGGAISAYVGSLGISLGTMVANLSCHKREYGSKWEEFSDIAEKGQMIKDVLLRLVDEDTLAFNKIMDAFGLPRSNPVEQKLRNDAIEAATKNAILVPFKVMQLAYDSMQLIKTVAIIGNPNSVSDAGVGALCAVTAVEGAFLNVKINCTGLKDKKFTKKKLEQGEKILHNSKKERQNILSVVNKKINGLNKVERK